jgi:hypothetical protein
MKCVPSALLISRGLPARVALPSQVVPPSVERSSNTS